MNKKSARLQQLFFGRFVESCVFWVRRSYAGESLVFTRKDDSCWWRYIRRVSYLFGDNDSLTSICLIYTVALFRGAQIGRSAKLLETLQSKNLNAALIRPGSRATDTPAICCPSPL